MSTGNLNHSGVLSSINKNNIGNSNYDPYYLLQSNNETIMFLDENGIQMQLNSLLIEAGNADLKIQLIPSNYVIYISANESRSIDYVSLTGIKVYNDASTQIRWSGCFY